MPSIPVIGQTSIFLDVSARPHQTLPPLPMSFASLILRRHLPDDLLRNAEAALAGRSPSPAPPSQSPAACLRSAASVPRPRPAGACPELQRLQHLLQHHRLELVRAVRQLRRAAAPRPPRRRSVQRSLNPASSSILIAPQSPLPARPPTSSPAGSRSHPAPTPRSSAGCAPGHPPSRPASARSGSPACPSPRPASAAPPASCPLENGARLRDLELRHHVHRQAAMQNRHRLQHHRPADHHRARALVHHHLGPRIHRHLDRLHPRQQLRHVLARRSPTAPPAGCRRPCAAGRPSSWLIAVAIASALLKSASFSRTRTGPRPASLQRHAPLHHRAKRNPRRRRMVELLAYCRSR